MGKITVIGTGYDREDLTLRAIGAFENAEHIFLHTDHCGCADYLREKGIPFESLDDIYEACEDFDEHIERVTEKLIGAAEAGDIAYAVFDVRDRTVSALISEAGEAVVVLPGAPVDGALAACASGACLTLSASDWEETRFSASQDCLIHELDSWALAAELKLKLMDCYPEETEVRLMYGEGRVKDLPLYRLDFDPTLFDHRTSLFIPAQKDILKLERFDFDGLNAIMQKLASPTGCPWDRVQTHQTLRTYILEEAYEVIDAIDAGDTDHLCEELGDMLFQVAFHAELGRKHGEFSVTDITTGICSKMIKRHSHIFGSDRAQNSEAVSDLWQQNKKRERGQTTQTEVLKDITRSLPALLRGLKLLKRSADADMCNRENAQAVEAVRRCLDRGAFTEESLGDLLLCVCDMARMNGIDPEMALNSASDRFIERFERAEKHGGAWEQVFPF